MDLCPLAAHAAAMASVLYRMKTSTFLNRDFSPQAAIDHVEGTMHYVVDTAHDTGTFAPGAEMNRQLNKRAFAKGLGNEDMTAIIKVLEFQSLDG
ncbi:MAG: NAD(P)-dependent oxidoreductase [Dehalococcoidia bacterium]|nr:NAD(P)-dependent oxidoreductase [Dehalococcoidia bacterium]